MAHQDFLSHLVGEGLAPKRLHGHCPRRQRPLDLRVEQVLLLQRAEGEVGEGLALVGDDAPVRAGLVCQATLGEAGQALEAARLREAGAELIRAALHGAADGLHGGHRPLRLHGGQRSKGTVNQHEDGVDCLLCGASMPQLDHVLPELRGLSEASKGGPQPQRPWIGELLFASS